MNMIMRVFAVFGALVCLPGMHGTSAAYDGPVYLPVQAHSPVLGNGRHVAMGASVIDITPDAVTFNQTIRSFAEQPHAPRIYLRVGPIEGSHSDNLDAFHGPLTTDPLALSVAIDGYGVKVRTDHAARLHGIDVTRRMEELGIPVSPANRDFQPAWDALSDAQRRAYLDDGLSRRTLDVTYSWPIEFPSKRTARMTTRYKPVLGETVDSLVKIMGEVVFGLEGYPLTELCLMPEQIDRINRLFSRFDDEDHVRPFVIRTMRLMLDRPHPGYTTHDASIRIAPRHRQDIVAVCGGEFSVEPDGTRLWDAKRIMSPELRIYFLELDPKFRAD